MQYRRAFTPGGCWFFTLVTYNRRPILAGEPEVELLRQSMRKVMERRPFTINAAVILPDHLHLIWTLPPGDADFSTRWRLIKSLFSKGCDPRLRATPNRSRTQKGELALWQRRYWEHLIRDEEDYNRHVEYIHYNPVKHGLVTEVKAWPYSSFHYYVDRDIYPHDWGGVAPMDCGGVGE